VKPLRWVVLLPGAVLTGYAAYLVGGTINGAGDDGDRVAESLFEKTTQDCKEAVREVVEAAEAGEAQEAGNEDHDIGRLHQTYLPAGTRLYQAACQTRVRRLRSCG